MSRRSGLPWVVAAAVAIVVAHGAGGHPAAAAPAPAAVAADARPGRAEAPAPAPWLKAVAYARAQLGKPYLWGGNGPAAFDCSGLVKAAWATAGVHMPRRSQEQWTHLRHISRADLRPGDLIFYAGADGTQAAPGHVVIYIGGGQVIQAYGTGTPIEISPLSDVGAGPLTGYARP